MIMTVLKITSQVCKCCLFMIRFRLYIFSRNIAEVGAVFFSLNPMGQHTILICSITTDVLYHHLIKVISARCLHYKVNLFPIYIFGGPLFYSNFLLINHPSFPLAIPKEKYGIQTLYYSVIFHRMYRHNFIRMLKFYCYILFLFFKV